MNKTPFFLRPEHLIKENMKALIIKLSLPVCIFFIALISFVAFIAFLHPETQVILIIIIPLIICQVIGGISILKLLFIFNIMKVIKQIADSDKIAINDINYGNNNKERIALVNLLIEKGHLKGYELFENRMVMKRSLIIKVKEVKVDF